MLRDSIGYIFMTSAGLRDKCQFCVIGYKLFLSLFLGHLNEYVHLFKVCKYCIVPSYFLCHVNNSSLFIIRI